MSHHSQRDLDSVSVLPATSFTSRSIHSDLINDKAQSHVFSLCYQSLSGPYRRYLLRLCQGRTAAHPKTLQARPAAQMILWRLGVSTGHAVITFGLNPSNRHNSAQL